MDTEYFVTKKESTVRFCQYCNGSGKKQWTMGGQKFVSNCTMCSGTGKQKTSVSSEVLLTEALKAMNLL
jgi:DnaJ-class molecular chaperone